MKPKSLVKMTWSGNFLITNSVQMDTKILEVNSRIPRSLIRKGLIFIFFGVGSIKNFEILWTSEEDDLLEIHVVSICPSKAVTMVNA